jgi:beta-glucanase (GH16 family)
MLWSGVLSLLLGGGLASGQTPAGQPLLKLTAPDFEKHIAVTSHQVTASLSDVPASPGIVVVCQPGKDGYPGITLTPPSGSAWDLSAFGHIDVRVVNTGAKKVALTVRVDNEGDYRRSPWSADNLSVEPGASATGRVLFGYSWGKKGYALKSNAIVRVLIFASKSDAVQSFRIESIEAGGLPGEKPKSNPATARIRPKNDVLVGPGVTIDPARQLQSRGAKASVRNDGTSAAIHILFPANKDDALVSLKPAIGRWDLGGCLELRVRIRNEGQAPVTPRVRVESNSRHTEWATTPEPLGPGTEREVLVPFISNSVWTGEKGSGNQLADDAVTAITFSTTRNETETALQIDSIRADLPPSPSLPDWLGRRPPVEGEWTPTFDEEFDGPAIDTSKWNIYGGNYWDHNQSHFSKDNVILGDGVVKLRFEKKPGHHNDDPKQHESEYATGYLDTFGKFTQRYGYFEARMKLPTTPGLWPAFWMMPDRGAGAKNRGSTSEGGMEFDIMEHLTCWGPNRYNIAMHWDGYGKSHKSIGTDTIYVQPDRDGFITAGLLWTPGLLVYYGNGHEVARWENPRVSNVKGDLMFTLPTGGWDNNELDEDRLPGDFVIDYVRVWQRKDLAQLP